MGLFRAFQEHVDRAGVEYIAFHGKQSCEIDEGQVKCVSRLVWTCKGGMVDGGEFRNVESVEFNYRG
ncbi:uncharacterized protein UV8b_01714 [Ustilaginoidea virens]|uniref:Uncharacterized protein n=1 Tax=Ustilaginoidea virens TaxID=1159556 RepID=A0A8E5HLH7_USTVR|nr:uncharacterized protein UV8b_01714 [Ustilaginoidea virens]QUC17473.1 hypothetical protein UV8b_01714 [Ustilaginoidea virens]